MYVFWGFDGVQRVGDFGEFLYFKASSGVFHVVQCVLCVFCVCRVLCFVADCFVDVLSVQDLWSV